MVNPGELAEMKGYLFDLLDSKSYAERVIRDLIKKVCSQRRT